MDELVRLIAMSTWLLPCWIPARSHLLAARAKTMHIQGWCFKSAMDQLLTDRNQLLTSWPVFRKAKRWWLSRDKPIPWRRLARKSSTTSHHSIINQHSTGWWFLVGNHGFYMVIETANQKINYQHPQTRKFNNQLSNHHFASRNLLLHRWWFMLTKLSMTRKSATHLNQPTSTRPQPNLNQTWTKLEKPEINLNQPTNQPTWQINNFNHGLPWHLEGPRAVPGQGSLGQVLKCQVPESRGAPMCREATSTQRPVVISRGNCHSW